jgi:hypothetical protein
MIYKRAFLVAFVILIVGLGSYFYSGNEINSFNAANPYNFGNDNWIAYQLFAEFIIGLAIALFIAICIKGIQSWIHW